MVREIANVGSLPQVIADLLVEAQSVAKNAYNPYSHFFVGAAALSSSGETYLGTFMENISLGVTICAEAAALLAANSSGDRAITAIAVVGGTSLSDGGPVVTPCGRCRQIIYELAYISGGDIDVYCSNGDLSSIIQTSVHELLPLAFTPAATGTA